MATKEALGMSLEISQEYIENLTKELLTQSLIETLDAKNTIVQSIVTEVLSTKVDVDGRPSTYRFDENRTYLKYLCEKMIRDEVVSVAEEVLEKNRAALRESIRKEISKKATMDKMTDCFINSVLDSMNNRYSTNVEFSFKPITD